MVATTTRFRARRSPFRRKPTSAPTEQRWSGTIRRAFGADDDLFPAFAKPKSGRIAVKVINHLGNEVMKVFAVR